MDGQIPPQWQLAVEQTLANYALQPLAVTFLQHSENVTFRVDANHVHYLLRLHVPLSPAFGAHGENPRAVNSEMLWLETLKKNRLPVPPPVKNRQKEYVTQVGKINATLLKWQAGELLTLESETEEIAAQMGTLVGRLHQQASRWPLPKNFTRPRRNSTYFENALLTLWPAVEDGRIAARDYQQLKTTLSWLSSQVRNLSQTRATAGLIHGDLHRGNFLVYRRQLRLIDFSMSGFGHFAYDLATCLSNVRVAHHPVFLERYTQNFPIVRGYEALVEAYFIASSIVTFALWINDAESQETLVRRVPYIAQEYAARFNRDERFWFTG